MCMFCLHIVVNSVVAISDDLDVWFFLDLKSVLYHH